jgi:hypothetical protein
MEPLDLSQHPPRPCREALDGIIFLPRAIDKARAALPGGNLGDYWVSRDDMRTLSGLFFRRLGIAESAFTAWVAEAATDADVAENVRGAADSEAIGSWNAILTGIHMRDLEESKRDFLVRTYGKGQQWSLDDVLIDVIDRDDAFSFA